MNSLLNPSRILLKLSWEALQWKWNYWIEVEFLQELSKNIVNLSKKWIQIVIVIWWWNIFRWVAGAAKWLDRSTADYMWMLATVMNWVALWDAIESNWVEVRVMTAIEMPKVAEPFIRRRAIKHLEKWRIIICVAGSGNPFFTTDSAAVLRALELNCNYLVKWTKVDWIYDKDPMKYEDAIKYDTLNYQEVLVKNLNIMDQSAIALAKDENLPIFVCSIDKINLIWSREDFGTLVRN